jgi:hypothetical protein
MNQHIENYLKQSTRWLWGRKKAEVKEELTTHIEGRVSAHLIAGLSESEAVEKTLAELGKPSAVSTGMTRIYTLPIMAISSMFMAVCLSLLMFLFTGSNAQAITGSFYWPTKDCAEMQEEGKISTNPERDYLNGVDMGDCHGFLNTLWLNFANLKPIFEAKDVKVTEALNMITLDFPDDTTVKFPLGNYDEFGLFDPCCYDDIGPMNVEAGYFQLWDLLKQTAKKPEIPMSIQGWDNPIITINNASFQIGTEKLPFLGEDFYNNYLSRVLFGLPNVYFGSYVAALGHPVLDRFLPNWQQKYAIKKQLKMKSPSISNVYGIIVILDLENPMAKAVDDPDPTYKNDSAFFLDFARVNPDNTVTFNLPNNENVQFVKELKSLPEPGSAILVDLSASNGAWYKIVSPELFTLE